MLLGCDIDGVVADFTGAVGEWVERTYGYKPIDPIDCWDWFLQYPDGKMVWRSVWNRGVRDEGLLLQCKPVDGALEGIQSLLDSGVDVEFVTHRHGDDEAIVEDTFQWLDWCGFGDLPVHFLENKWELGADIYVDDKPATIAELLHLGHNAALFTQPWNVNEPLPRVDSWNALVWALTVTFTEAA